LKYHIILASKSPRRKELLSLLGINFEAKIKEVEEVFPQNLKREKVAIYLSELKANAFKDEIKNNEIVITSDTIVCLDDEIIGKPKNKLEAIMILEKLSGKKHSVITGVTLFSKSKIKSFFVETEVYFKKLTIKEIQFYVENYKPYDKAGAYGIQEWIGAIAVEKIKGSYYNVMGLPTKELYEELSQF